MNWMTFCSCADIFDQLIWAPNFFFAFLDDKDVKLSRNELNFSHTFKVRLIVVLSIDLLQMFYLGNILIHEFTNLNWL